MKLLLIFLLLGITTMTTSTASETEYISPKPASVVIYGQIKDSVALESVKLTVYPCFISSSLLDPAPIILHTKPVWGNFEAYGEQKFKFTVPELKGPAYITIRHGFSFPVEQFLIEPGDSVKMQIDLRFGRIVFAGPAAMKFKCQYDLARARAQDLFSQNAVMRVWDKKGLFQSDSARIAFDKKYQGFGRKLDIKLINPIEDFQSVSDYIENSKWEKEPAWQVLQTYRGKVPDNFLRVLEADLFSSQLEPRLNTFRREYEHAVQKGMTEAIKVARKIYFEQLSKFPVLQSELSAAAISAGYPKYLYEVMSLKDVMENNKTRYETIRDNLQGALRDRALAYYLLTFSNQLGDLESALKDALTFVKDPVREPLHRLYNRKMKGAKAFDFTLPNYDSSLVKMSDFKGKVVFIDFWFTGCTACVSFYKTTLSKVEEHFRHNPDFVMMTISEDESREKWKNSIRQGKYTSRSSVNLWDGQKETFAYYNITGVPHQLMVDKDGRVYRSGDLRKSAPELISIIEGALRK